MKKIISLMIFILSFITACNQQDDMLPGGSLPEEYADQGTITVKNNRVKICVWDWGTIDGDIIHLLVNGKYFLKEYTLTGNKECFEVNLSDGENWIGVIALAEGYNPPPSPHVEISDGESVQDFEILAYINKAGGYKIRVQK